MITTNDGRQFVFAVFEADGCECKFLSGLFGTQEAAERHQKRQRDAIATAPNGPYCFAWEPEWVTIEMLPLDEVLDPLTNYEVVKA